MPVTVVRQITYEVAARTGQVGIGHFRHRKVRTAGSSGRQGSVLSTIRGSGSDMPGLPLIRITVKRSVYGPSPRNSFSGTLIEVIGNVSVSSIISVSTTRYLSSVGSVPSAHSSKLCCYRQEFWRVLPLLKGDFQRCIKHIVIKRSVHCVDNATDFRRIQVNNGILRNIRLTARDGRSPLAAARRFLTSACSRLTLAALYACLVSSPWRPFLRFLLQVLHVMLPRDPFVEVR